jgi:tetratricopeptide (TPR) repeat protein
MNRAIIGGAAAAALVVSGAAYWALGPEAGMDSEAAGVASSKTDSTATLTAAGVDWRKRWPSLGLKGALASLPDHAGASIAAAAKSAANPAGVKALLQGHAKSGALKALPSSRARRHPVRTAELLMSELAKGTAKEVHEVEIAWLAASLLVAQGHKIEFVTDAANLQTPVLLSRTRLGVRVGDQVIAPLGGDMSKPRVVTAATAAGWWLIQRAYVHRAASNFSEAHALLAAAAELGPEATAGFARGVVEMDQGLIDRGLDRCAKALMTTDDPMARLFLADVLNQLQRPFKAWQQVEVVLKRYPKLAEAHASKGIIDAARVATIPEKDKAAKLDTAAASLRKALALDAEVAGARAALAQVLMLQEKTDEAEKLLVEAVDQHRDASAAALLGELWRTPEHADKLIEKLMPLAADGDVRIAVGLVGAHLAKEDLPAALSAAQAAFKANPDDPNVGLLHADMLRQNGKNDEAISALDKLRATSPDPQIGMLQAQMLLQVKRPEQAVTLLEELSKKPPVSKELRVLMLMAYKQAGKQLEADAVISKALSEAVLRPLDVAGVLIELGDADGAVKILEKALAGAAVLAEEAQMLAMIYTAGGRKNAAIKLRDRLVAKAGAKGAELKESLDQAIAGAAAELEVMAKEDAAATKP